MACPGGRCGADHAAQSLPPLPPAASGGPGPRPRSRWRLGAQLFFNGDLAAAADPRTPRWALRVAASRAWRHPALAGKLEALASNPRLPARWMKKLELAGNTPVLKALAANPAASPQTLAWLAGDFRDGVAAAAVAHPNCPPDVLAEVASALAVPDDVRRAAAANPNCPPLSRVVGGLLAD